MSSEAIQGEPKAAPAHAQRPTGRLDFRRMARSKIWWFLAIGTLIFWVVSFTTLLEADSSTWRWIARMSGWAAFLSFLVPFLHIIRVALLGRRQSWRPTFWPRCLLVAGFVAFCSILLYCGGRGAGWSTLVVLISTCLVMVMGILAAVLGHRQTWWLGGQTFWLRCHIFAAFAAFFFTLLHSGGHAAGWLTLVILILVWLVMLSGLVGFWGRRLIYRLLHVAIRSEFGRARVRTKERGRLQRRAQRLVDAAWKLTEHDIAPAQWQAFCAALANEEVNLKPTSLWERVKESEKKTIEEAARAFERISAGERLSVGAMNPLIGVLNEFLEKPRSVTLDELKQFVADREPPPEEKPNVEQQRRRALLTKAEEELKRTHDLKEQNQIRVRVMLEMLFADLRECRPPAAKLREFFDNYVQPVMKPGTEAGSRQGTAIMGDDATPSWGWIFTAEARDPISEAIIQSYQLVLDTHQQALLEQLMKWVRRRRRLNLEEWFDRLANCWLWVHGVLAAVLGALVLDHVVGSVFFAW